MVLCQSRATVYGAKRHHACRTPRYHDLVLTLATGVNPNGVSIVLTRVTRPSSYYLVIVDAYMGGTVPFVSIHRVQAILVLIGDGLRCLRSQRSEFFRRLSRAIYGRAGVLYSRVRLSGVLFGHARRVRSQSLFPIAGLNDFVSMQGKVVLVGTSRVISPCRVVGLRAVYRSTYPPYVTYFLIVFPIVGQVSPRLPYNKGDVQQTSNGTSQGVFLVGLRRFQLYPNVHAIGHGMSQSISSRLRSLDVYVDFRYYPLFGGTRLLRTMGSRFFYGLLSFFDRYDFFSIFRFHEPFSPTSSVWTILSYRVRTMVFRPNDVFFCGLAMLLIYLAIVVFGNFSRGPGSKVVGLLVVRVTLIYAPIAILTVAFVRVSLFCGDLRVGGVQVSHGNEGELM